MAKNLIGQASPIVPPGSKGIKFKVRKQDGEECVVCGGVKPCGAEMVKRALVWDPDLGENGGYVGKPVCIPCSRKSSDIMIERYSVESVDDEWSWRWKMSLDEERLAE